MPLYDIRCEACGDEKEVFLKLTERTPKCASCGSNMKKVISSTTFILKGKGWAKDNYGLKSAKRSREAK
ncbi:MAG: zinc ribbon domain-containing protein [Tenericutes bacterium]|nr:MAG: zinc ribbon domain-containing protein [Mycoplasmatota bacterium]